MAELFNNKEIKNLITMEFVISSIIVKIAVESLECMITRKQILQKFLRDNFRYWKPNWSNNKPHLKHVDLELRKFYFNNNKSYPNSLTDIDLDITGLNAIRLSFSLDKGKEEYIFFDYLTELRNSCFHVNKMDETLFERMRNLSKTIINECPFIDFQKKNNYLSKLNYIYQNLLIIDAKTADQVSNKKNKIVIRYNGRDFQVNYFTLKLLKIFFLFLFSSTQRQILILKY